MLLAVIAASLAGVLVGVGVGFVWARRTRFARVNLRGLLVDHMAETGKPLEVSLGYTATLEYADDPHQTRELVQAVKAAESRAEGGGRCSR